MKIFEKYKFINRFSKLPRDIFTKSKTLNLTCLELDIVFKLLNFKINENDIYPNLNKISERSGTSVRSYQRAFSSLKEKGYLSISQNKDENGRFSVNTYNMDWIFSIIDTLSKQLYIDFNTNRIFWDKSSNLGNCSFIAVPKILDFFQKKLDINQKELLFLKYLFWYIDDNWISEISLNQISKTTPLSRTILQKLVSSLSDKWFIKVKEQYHWRSKIRVRNRYDIKPLLNKLNELEREKVEWKLKEKWLWKDFTKTRKHRNLSTFSDKENTKNKNKINKQERVFFLENEVRRLQLDVFGKDSESAKLIREYQNEINSLKYWDIDSNSIWNLIKERFKKVDSVTDFNSDVWYQAKLICDKLNWNWNKSFNMYIKAVKYLPWTVDRFVWCSLEKAKYKERYFAKCISKELKKLNLT